MYLQKALNFYSKPDFTAEICSVILYFFIKKSTEM